MNGALVIPARVETGGCTEASRYRLLAKIQLTAPGRCRHLGLLRNFLAEGDCSAGVVSIVIPGYVERWGYELDKYQVYARFVLLDTVTGYRSQSQDYCGIVKATSSEKLFQNDVVSTEVPTFTRDALFFLKLLDIILRCSR